jgi:transposase-like protein
LEKNVAAEISKGGGVYAKAKIVGPRQDRWLMLLEKIDREEVERAVREVVREAASLVNAAAHLDVKPDFLLRYKLPASKIGGRRLPPYRPPTTVEAALPIVRARVSQIGKGGIGSGAWRVEDLLDDARSKRAALGALKVIVDGCSTIGDVAEAFDVTRRVIWLWRKRWPEVDAIIAPKKSDRKPRGGAVKLKTKGGRRLTLEEAIDLMKPHLPGQATDVAAGIADAASLGESEHKVTPTARELSFYVGKPDARGLMVARWSDRWGDRIVKVWALVDTKTGKRIDGKGNDGRSGRPRGRPRKRERAA